MSPSHDALIEQLLSCRSQAERLALLEKTSPRPDPVLFVSTLKEQSDFLLYNNLTQAKEIAIAALDVAKFSQDAKAQAIASWADGNILFYQGNYSACLVRYEQTIAYYSSNHADTGDDASISETLLRLHVNCASVFSQMGEYAQALAQIVHAQKLRSDATGPRYLLSMEMTLAWIEYQLDDYDAALESTQRGELYATQLGDKTETERIRINMALALEGLGRYQEALDLLSIAAQTLAEHSVVIESARAHLNLGLVHFRMGSYRASLVELDNAQEKFGAAQNEIEIAVVGFHRAKVYRRLNLLTEAVQVGLSAYKQIAQRHELAHYASEALYDISLAMGELDESTAALEYLEKARAEVERLELPIQTAQYDMTRAALMLQSQATTTPSFPQIIALLQQALAIFDTKNIWLHSLWAKYWLAEANLLQNKRVEARDLLEELVGHVETANLGELRYRVLFRLGCLAEDAEPQAATQTKALAYYAQALETLITNTDLLDTEKLYVDFIASKQPLFERAISLYLQTGQLEQALYWVELARYGAWATSNISLPATREDERGKDEQRAYGERQSPKIEQLRTQWRYFYTRLNSLNMSEPLTEHLLTKRVGFYRDKLKEIEQQLSQAIRVARLQQPRQIDEESHYFLFQSDNRVAHNFVRDCQRTLTPQHCMLVYFCTPQQTFAFLIEPSDLTVITIDIHYEQIQRWLARLRLSIRWQQDDCAAHLHTLWRWLIEPVADSLRLYTGLTIVPHGLLYHIPFHALIHSNDGDKSAYLLNMLTIRYLPSLHRRGGFSQPGELTNATYEQSQVGNDAPSRDARWQKIAIFTNSDQGQLPGAAAEGELIQRVIADADGDVERSCSLYSESQATIERFFKEADDCHILHIAAHAYFRYDNPLFSLIRLGDGPLLVADLNTLHLAGRPLVVLSACETALGHTKGSAILGISQAFLSAGAGALLVSLWRVPDDATTQIMQWFYEQLFNGLDPANALQKAQAMMMRTPNFHHPLHWAGWIVIDQLGNRN